MATDLAGNVLNNQLNQMISKQEALENALARLRAWFFTR